MHVTQAITPRARRALKHHEPSKGKASSPSPSPCPDPFRQARSLSARARSAGSVTGRSHTIPRQTYAAGRPSTRPRPASSGTPGRRSGRPPATTTTSPGRRTRGRPGPARRGRVAVGPDHRDLERSGQRGLRARPATSRRTAGRARRACGRCAARPPRRPGAARAGDARRRRAARAPAPTGPRGWRCRRGRGAGDSSGSASVGGVEEAAVPGARTAPARRPAGCRAVPSQVTSPVADSSASAPHATQA